MAKYCMVIIVSSDGYVNLIAFIVTGRAYFIKLMTWQSELFSLQFQLSDKIPNHTLDGIVMPSSMYVGPYLAKLNQRKRIILSII